MMKTVIRSVLASVIAMSVLSTSANADDDDVMEMKAIANGLGFVSLEAAKASALAAKPGVVTDVELDDRSFSDGWDYEFEIVDAEGKEWDVYVDAKSGEVRKVRRDWF